MNRICPAGKRDLKNEITAQIRLYRRRRTQAIRLVCMEHVQTTAVRIGVDGHWRYTKLAAAAKNAQRDLAAIGNQNLAKGSHQSRILTGGRLAALAVTQATEREAGHADRSLQG